MYQTFSEIFNDADVQKQLKDLNQEQVLCGSYAEATEMVGGLYDSYRGVADSLGILAPGMVGSSREGRRLPPALTVSNK